MKTGCSLLDAKGIKVADKGTIKVPDEEVIQYCVPCHLCKCRLEDVEGREFYYNEAVYHAAVDQTYQCMKCGDMETLSFINGMLQPTRKFTQVGEIIYHTSNCGECRKIG